MFGSVDEYEWLAVLEQEVSFSSSELGQEAAVVPDQDYLYKKTNPANSFKVSLKKQGRLSPIKNIFFF